MAVHKGPYLTLQALEEPIGAGNVRYLVDGVSKQERNQSGLPYLDRAQITQHWGSLEEFLERSSIQAIVRSTSEDVTGANLEDQVSTAAQITGTPLFVLEDFPGLPRLLGHPARARQR